MSTHVFASISRRAVRTGECRVCHKKGRRATTITNTVNPFNKNPDGTVRTRVDVYRHVAELAAEWSALPFVHAGCEPR